MKMYCALLLLLTTTLLLGQTNEFVDVTFFWKETGNATNVFLPGEFNGWNLNSASRMTRDAQTGIWSKTVQLRVGGPDPLPSPNSIAGAYQYKIHHDGNWISDPLNPRQNPQDNNNSYLYIRNPVIHYLLPNSALPASGTIRTNFPEISAYIFPSLSSTVEADSISVMIDDQAYTNLESHYDPVTNVFSFTPPDPLGNGSHTLHLSVQSSNGSQNTDSTTFTIQADAAQIQTRDAETRKSTWPIQGGFYDAGGGFDTTLTSAEIIRSDSTWMVAVAAGRVDTSITLLEGVNAFTLQATIDGQLETSAPVEIERIVSHFPVARTEITQSGSTLTFNAAASSDPDGQTLTYTWSEESSNPDILGIDGQSGVSVSAAMPSTPGEYYVTLTATDPDQNIDAVQSFFTIIADSPQVDVAGYADNPAWVKDGRIYLMFFKAFTPEGTIQAAIENLDYVEALGLNTIWVLPVMDVPGSIDNQINIGYNIIDFFNVDPSLGTNQDFRDFIQAAHDRDIRVILDITPNHSGRDHPLAQEARQFKGFSPYWNYYQTSFIPHDDHGLGKCETAEGIHYYCAFSDALLNWNWNDLDAREYMIGVYEHWVRNYDLDGFRFDVYWGPHARYGEDKFGTPVRERLKKIKPDILLIGESGGTGIGSEVVFADRNGGLDAAYDWGLYHDAFKNFSFTSSAVTNLHDKLNNDGFYPGENSYFLRFLENQDEDRISYVFNSFVKTMPLATVLFTAPGLPLMYNGQEVGFGRGIGSPGEPDLNDRRRGVIDWAFAGKDLLQPHYHKIAQIRAQFPAFRQHKRDTNGDGQVNSSDEADFKRVTTSNGVVYAFTRPYMDDNGLTVVNFGSGNNTVTMNLTTGAAGLKFSDGLNPNASYWVNDLYNDTSYQALGSELSNFSVTLDGYGSDVFSVSIAEKSIDLPTLPSIVGVEDRDNLLPSGFLLNQNYPNPFNPTTVISYQLPIASEVEISVFNILGQQVKTLVAQRQPAGAYTVEWDATNDAGAAVASGIYLYRIQAGVFIQTHKMLLVR